MLSFFPRGVLDEILNLIESVSEGFPSYSLLMCTKYFQHNNTVLLNGFLIVKEHVKSDCLQLELYTEKKEKVELIETIYHVLGYLTFCMVRIFLVLICFMYFSGIACVHKCKAIVSKSFNICPICEINEMI